MTHAMFSPGQPVRLRFNAARAEIVETRGPLGPDGAMVYRVAVIRPGGTADDDDASMVEVCEDQLEEMPVDDIRALMDAEQARIERHWEAMLAARKRLEVLGGLAVRATMEGLT